MGQRIARYSSCQKCITGPSLLESTPGEARRFEDHGPSPSLLRGFSGQAKAYLVASLLNSDRWVCCFTQVARTVRGPLQKHFPHRPRFLTLETSSSSIPALTRRKPVVNIFFNGGAPTGLAVRVARSATVLKAYRKKRATMSGRLSMTWLRKG